MTKMLVLVPALLLLPALSAAQNPPAAQLITPAAPTAPPETDIFLAKIVRPPADAKDPRPRFEEVANATARVGYDNQPSFAPDGKSFFYTRTGETDATDIWSYDLAAKKGRQITKTGESEYSPTLMADGKGISVVRVEKDGTQRLWRFPLDGSGEPSLILPNVAPVGYHVWGDGDLLLFVLGEPHRLERATPGTGKAEELAQDIGRALHKIPGKEAWSFVHKEGGEWWVKSVDWKSGEIKPIIQTMPEKEDLVWTPEGELWAASGAKLFTACLDCGGWTEIADFSSAGAKEITRLAIDAQGKTLAFVTTR